MWCDRTLDAGDEQPLAQLEIATILQAHMVLDMCTQSRLLLTLT